LQPLFRPVFTQKAAYGFAGAALVSGMCYKSFSADAKDESTALSPEEFRDFPLHSVTYYNHNTNIFRIQFPRKDQESGLSTASFLLIKGQDSDGKTAVRPYTPVSTNDTKGHCDLLIKKYPNGNVSQYVHGLKVGDSVSVKGPFKKLEYEANMKKDIGMIAGGTGITPMIQVLQTIFRNPEDKTKVAVIFANIAEEDILCRELLDGLAKEYPDRFKVHYTLDKPPAGWKGGEGFVSESMAKANLPKPSDDTLILFCGPPPMLKAVAGPKGPNFTQGDVGGVLSALGYTNDMVYKF